MECSSIGHHFIHDKTFRNDRPKGSDTWLLLLIKSPALFYIDGMPRHVKANSYILYSLRTPQHYAADGEAYIDDWMHFYPDAEEQQLIRQLSIPLNQPVHIGNIAAASAIIKYMCFEFYSAHQSKHEIATLYFRMLLYKLHDQNRFHYSDAVLTETRHIDQLLWVRESIFRWPEQEWDVETMAKELELSTSRFLHLYKEAFGSTMMQDVIDSRIQRSCELLKTTEQKISDIAEACGYSSIPHFTMLFREKTGMTPLAYRKAARNGTC